MSIHESNQFVPLRVVVLSELTTREKEKYYSLLLTNKVRFHRDETGRYVASLRLLAPGVKKETEIKRVLPSSGQSLPLEERLGRLNQEYVNVRIAGVDPFDYAIYNRFSLLIAVNGDVVRPKPQSLSWLMKRIESLYDARFAHEKMDVERDDTSFTSESIVAIFPMFVVKWLSMEKGLIKTIVDQNCWDLLYNVHCYRRDYLEVEVFARFLQEFYDNDDLLFYLYVRSVVSKVLHVSFRTQWAKSEGPARQPKGLWMSHRECVHVARIVFGADNNVMWQRFLNLVSPQMVGQKTATSDSRRIDITQFLHLAVVGYHQAAQQPPPGAAGGGGGQKETSENHEQPGVYSEDIPQVEVENDAPFVQNSGFADQIRPDFNSVDEEEKFASEYHQIHQTGEGEEIAVSWLGENMHEDYGNSLDAYLAALTKDKIGEVSGSRTSTQKGKDDGGVRRREVPETLKEYYHHDQHFPSGATRTENLPPTKQAVPTPTISTHKFHPLSSGVDSDSSGSNTPTRNRKKQAARLSAPPPSVKKPDNNVVLDEVGSEDGVKSFLNEVGQWQDEDVHHPHPSEWQDPSIGITKFSQVDVPAPSRPAPKVKSEAKGSTEANVKSERIVANVPKNTETATVKTPIESAIVLEKSTIPNPAAPIQPVKDHATEVVTKVGEREIATVHPTVVPLPQTTERAASTSTTPPEAGSSRRNSLKQRLAARMNARKGLSPDSQSGDITDDSRSHTPFGDHDHDHEDRQAEISAEAIAEALGKITAEDNDAHENKTADASHDSDPKLSLWQRVEEPSSDVYDGGDAKSDHSDHVTPELQHDPEYPQEPSTESPELFDRAETDNHADVDFETEASMQQNDSEPVAEESDEFATLQLDREREFLSFLCEPLGELPENIAEDMVAELANQLRTKINDAVEGKVITDIDTFDGLLVDILQSEELRFEMESMRDAMLKYLFDQIEQQAGDAGGEHQEEEE